MEETTETLVKLNLGAKTSTQHEDYISVPAEALYYCPWEYDTESVDEIICANYFHYVGAYDRFPFMDEVYRILKVGGTITLITPYWSNELAYVDPMSQWPPITPTSYAMYNKEWRKVNDLLSDDYIMNSNFSVIIEGTFNDDSKTKGRSVDVIAMRTLNYLNAVDNLKAVLTKLPEID